MPRADARDVHGALVVDKPSGPSSHDIVAVARRALGISRIGHTGTLDPLASGVLVLVIGQATRLANYLMAAPKEYVARVEFGRQTTTYDSTGEVVAASGRSPEQAALIAALADYRGERLQTPPQFSAKMVAGERSYARARRGESPVTAPVLVTSHALELLSYMPPMAEIRVRCSAGFYVRSLTHDLGTALGTGALLARLVRTEAAGFTLAGALPLQALVGLGAVAARGRVQAMETLLPNVPALTLSCGGELAVRHGREVLATDSDISSAPAADLYRLCGNDGRLLALARPAVRADAQPGALHPYLVFSYN